MSSGHGAAHARGVWCPESLLQAVESMQTRSPCRITFLPGLLETLADPYIYQGSWVLQLSQGLAGAPHGRAEGTSGPSFSCVA